MSLYKTVICQYQFICTKKWEDLVAVDAKPDMRHCPECDQSVFLARNYEDFVNLASARKCVAVMDEKSTGQLLGSPNFDLYRVDVIEEANAYLKYSRIEQAIQILKEASDEEDSNFDVLFRLLEIYRDLSDAVAFEIYAKKALVLSRGEGELWEKIQAMGFVLDPKNSLYIAPDLS